MNKWREMAESYIARFRETEEQSNQREWLLCELSHDDLSVTEELLKMVIEFRDRLDELTA